jgi:hypothetical protein
LAHWFILLVSSVKRDKRLGLFGRNAFPDAHVCVLIRSGLASSSPARAIDQLGGSLAVLYRHQRGMPALPMIGGGFATAFVLVVYKVNHVAPAAGRNQPTIMDAGRLNALCGVVGRFAPRCRIEADGRWLHWAYVR